MNDLPFAPACERNKRPILVALRPILPERGRLLEIGSGTGQHAVFIAPEFPELTWHTSERAPELEGLRARIDLQGEGGLPPPMELDVLTGPWPVPAFHVVYSANTAHIMSWQAVCCMFSGVARVLAPGGVFCLYGPFNVDGACTAPSNAEFDQSLRARDPAMGLRDTSELVVLADRHGMDEERRIEMPANNLLLVYRRRTAPRA
jgi:SAM-dependent methyltransferase